MSESKKEHIRHIDKTRQDKMPVAERPRVKEWLARQGKSVANVDGTVVRIDNADEEN